MKKIFTFFFIFFFITKPLQASIKEKIILNLKNTKNITFEFEQTINNILEQGECTIEYPKKIFCLYNNKKKKILVTNGKTLVITNKQKSNYYLNPLKDFLISEIESLNGRNVDNKYYNFTILNNNNKINIFFNNKNYNLIGWQTEDIYQNLAITFISNVKTNQKIDKKIFKIPKMKMN